jgi:hypothetical protein
MLCRREERMLLPMVRLKHILKRLSGIWVSL